MTMKIPLCLTHIAWIMFVLLVGILFTEKVSYVRMYFIFVEEQRHQVSEQTVYLDRN